MMPEIAKTERWVKWSIGIMLGLVVYIVSITNDYASFKAETRVRLDRQGVEQLEVNKRFATAMERLVSGQTTANQQHDAVIRLLEYVDRDLNGERAPRGRSFDK